MPKRIVILMVGFGLASSLSFGGSFAHAAASDVLGDVDVTPATSYIYIMGDEDKLQEDYWTQAGFSAGIPEFSRIKEYKNGTVVEAEGRFIEGDRNHDYLFELNAKKPDLGSLSFEFKQFRKFYDRKGGFYESFVPPRASGYTWQQVSRALFLDIGNIKFEAVLEQEKAPKVTFAYEREYVLGAKSLTSWGQIVGVNPQGVATTRNILPTFLEIDEIVDKLELKVEDTIMGIDMSLEQTWEGAKIDTSKCSNRTLTLATNQYTSVRMKYEDLNSDSYTTIFRAEKEMNEKAILTCSALYNYYRGHTIETITDTSVTAFNENNPNSPATVIQNTITVLPKVSITLLDNMLMDIGLKWEFVNKQGDANYNRDRTNPPDGTLEELMIIKTEENENRLGESIDFKYDGFQDISLFTGVQFEQQARSQDEKQDDIGMPLATNTANFGRNAGILTYDYKTDSGFKWYVVPKLDITADIQFSYSIRDYDNGSKVNQIADVMNGYRGYLDTLSISTLKPTIALNYKPFKRLTCNLRYSFIDTTYGVSTRRATDALFTKYIAQLYSAGATYTPYDPLYFTFFFQKKDATTTTPLNDNGGPGGVNNLPLYSGGVNTLNATCGYSPYKDITFRGTYSLSLCNNFNDYSITGLPLGLDNYIQNAGGEIQRKIREDVTLGFKYNYMQYDETSNGGIDSYRAHLFYSTLDVKF